MWNMKTNVSIFVGGIRAFTNKLKDNLTKRFGNHHVTQLQIVAVIGKAHIKRIIN